MDIVFGLVNFLAPGVAGASIAYVLLALKRKRLSEGSRTSLLPALVVSSIVAGAGITLTATITWMVWYEKTTGYSAGNAPLGWIFFFGPAGVAISFVVGFMVWQYGHGKRGQDLLP